MDYCLLNRVTEKLALLHKQSIKAAKSVQLVKFYASTSRDAVATTSSLSQPGTSITPSKSNTTDGIHLIVVYSNILPDV